MWDGIHEDDFSINNLFKAGGEMKLSRFLFGAFLGLSLCAISGQAQAANPVKFTLAHTGAPGTSMALGYEKFAELVKEKSNGEIIIDIVGGGALAGDQTAVEGTKMGTLDMGSSATNNMAQFTKAFWVTDLPYIFKDIESSHKVWWGPIGDKMREQASKDIGAQVLFFIDTGGGFRYLANNKKQVRTPEDAKGLKLRTTGSPQERAAFRKWGATATPIPWPEVYTALEQHVVDGESLHAQWLDSAKHYESLKHLTKMNAFSNAHGLLMSNKAWNKLTPEQQQIIMEAGREMQPYQAALDAQQGKESLDTMIKAGLVLYEPTPEEAAEWEKVTREIWADFAKDIPQEKIDEVLKAQE